MNKTHKIISLVLVLILVFSCTAVFPASAAQTDSSAGDSAPSPAPDFIFRNTLLWNNVYMYAWNADGDGLTGEWPGTMLTLSGYDEFGYGEYTIFVPNGTLGIIFTDGEGNQTAEIKDFDPAGGGYYLDAEKTTDSGYMTEVYVPIPFDEEKDSYIVGDADSSKNISISDVTAIQKFLADARIPKNYNGFAADADQNEIITIDDATLVQFYLAGIERKNNHCNTVIKIDPFDDSRAILEYYDLSEWGKVSLLARDKDGNRLPSSVEIDRNYEYKVRLPLNTASTIIISEDGTKRTAPCEPSGFINYYFTTIYVSWDNSNNRHVLNYDIPSIGGLVPNANFVNSLGWEKVYMEEWDEFGNMVKATRLSLEKGKYNANPHFYARKITFGDGNGHRTDFVSNYYVIPGQADTYIPDEGKTTVNELGETVYVLKKYPYGEYSDSLLFVNSLQWDEIYVYAWDDEGKELEGIWPGKKLTEFTIDDYGQEVYTVSFPSNTAGIIFSDDKGNQTDDITDFSHSGIFLDSNSIVNNIFGSPVYKPITFDL